MAQRPDADPKTESLRTRLIHHPYEPPAGFGAPQPPVHKGSTVFFDSVAAMVPSIARRLRSGIRAACDRLRRIGDEAVEE